MSIDITDFLEGRSQGYTQPTQQNKNSFELKFPLNGVVRRCCPSCFFYSNDVWFQCQFPEYADIDDCYDNQLFCVSHFDYSGSKLLASLYDAPCPCFISRSDALDLIRSHVQGGR